MEQNLFSLELNLNGKSKTKEFPKECSINDLLKQLADYYVTKRSNLTKYVKILFDEKEQMNFFYEATFEELEKNGVKVQVYLDDALSYILQRSFKTPCPKNFASLRVNLVNYLFDFYAENQLLSVRTLNKRVSNIIRNRKFNILKTIKLPDFAPMGDMDFKEKFLPLIPLDKIKNFYQLDFKDPILNGYQLFYLGLTHEFGIENEKDLVKSLKAYKEGAKMNNIYCLLRMWYIYTKDYSQFGIESHNYLGFLAFLKLYAFQKCFHFVKAEIIEGLDLMTFFEKVMEDYNMENIKMFIKHSFLEESEKKLLKNILFSCLGKNTEKSFHNILESLHKGFNPYYFFFYFSVINNESTGQAFAKSQTLFHFYQKHFNDIFGFLKKANLFISFFQTNTFFYDFFTLLNYDIYDLMKLSKALNKKNTTFVESLRPYFKEGNNFINQFNLVGDKLIKLLTYSIKLKTIFWEKDYDLLEKEILKFMSDFGAEYQNNFGSLYYLLIKIYLAKGNKKSAEEYNTKLNLIYLNDATYNPKCSYYIAKSRKNVLGNKVEYYLFLRNGLNAFILRNNITQLYYYSVLSFKELKKAGNFNIKKLFWTVKDCKVKEFEFDNFLDYKNFMMTVLYINSQDNNYLQKVYSYEKKKEDNKIKLKLYIEKKDNYIALRDFCKDLTIFQRIEVLMEIIKNLFSFHKNYVVLNNLSPSNIYMSKKDKHFVIDPYSAALNSTGIEYLNPKLKFGNEIRFSSRNFLLFNVNDFTNDFYSIALILYEMVFEVPFKNCNNNQIIDLMRKNIDFMDMHPCKNEKVSPQNLEIIVKIIEKYTRPIKMNFYPLTQANKIIDELRKVEK